MWELHRALFPPHPSLPQAALVLPPTVINSALCRPFYIRRGQVVPTDGVQDPLYVERMQCGTEGRTRDFCVGVGPLAVRVVADNTADDGGCLQRDLRRAQCAGVVGRCR